ncbi:hypothetical protein TBLA_0D00950 [Henningerozyma blattae CBS 6284]|uniref:Cation-transporting ATPase n=1 Tax=Henningerozyma blattae (strain ATCC 34711 / CBS 6284 / DSM 70876 / NBRC 10599 / NRRL Y-10934 / UCD 77-7) TaxID=1071380 RepID=I2H2K1_HENB6|nr:hypothetical protein TBLA_0D00950 [Tetrapisispora blattae CBS 6284]CCH60603.1 hypothetical protein TBLA_0D00950 [Tetrapisispora blattae CBS 6284]
MTRYNSYDPRNSDGTNGIAVPTNGRPRNSFSSMHTNSTAVTLTSSTVVDQNQIELYSGATFETVPTSIVSFHHPHSFQSNLMTDGMSDSSSRIEQRGRQGAIATSPLMNSRSGSESRVPNFRFFTEEQITSAEGSSTLEPADYNVEWNSIPEYENNRLRGSNIGSRIVSRRSSMQSNISGGYGALKSRSRSMSRVRSFQNNQNQYTPEPVSDLYPTRSHSSDLSSKYNDRNRVPLAIANEAINLFGEQTSQHSILDNSNDELLEEADNNGSKSVDSNTVKKTAFLTEYLKANHYEKFYPNYQATLKFQRFYLAEEDLLIGIAGYQTSKLKLFLYHTLCFISCGLFYILLRWMPKYKIKLTGKAVPLGKAEWVAVENELGELSIIDVERKWYNRLLSTILPITYDETTMNNNEQRSVHHHEETPENPNIPIIISFQYRYINFIFSPLEDIFKVNSNWADPQWSNLQDTVNGLTTATQEDRLIAFGKNSIDLKMKTTSEVLFQEVLHPFYVFQIFSIILWSLDEYYYYAGCIFLISVLSILDSLLETKKTSQRLSEIAHFQCEVRVFRDGFWTHINASELVPGDVYEISDPKLAIFPCDSVILNGTCIVNESILTGESVPISKIPINEETIKDLLNDLRSTQISNLVSKSFLFNGTKLIRTSIPHNQNAALAMVVRTGFSTIKGSLVRSMVFPKPVGFKFYEDSFKYIGYMSLIAMVGLIISCAQFMRLGLDHRTMILRCLDIITIVVPPALPATLTIGTNFAISRFKKKKIFCISPTRVNVGGKIDAMCFDKTGTLTEDGLDILGVHITKTGPHKLIKFSNLIKDVHKIFPKFSLNDCTSIDDVKSRNFLVSILTCHSLRLVDGALLGDPLDFKMFEFTGWSFEEEFQTKKFTSMYEGRHEGIIFPENTEIIPAIVYPNKDDSANQFIENDPHNYLGIIKTFEFLSELRYMSVIVKPSCSDSYWAFTKGAPEVMYDICDRSTIPTDYEDMLQLYTHNGYRVIACAGKRLQKNTWLYTQKVKREEVESNLEFLGFIVFENKLKEASKPTLNELHRANIRTIMCTGDNILTAISVGKESELIQEKNVYIPSIFEDNFITNQYPIKWAEIDDPDNILDSKTLKPINGDQDYTLAASGDIFRIIFGNERDIQFSDDYKNSILLNCSVYARMSPDEKHELMIQLQKIDYTIGFCGDGANDCGALKSADVGISLSEAEASVAAPFTSQIFDISCVLDVIKEGRASLVTSFACFQYMTLYSAIQFITITILYGRGSNLGDFQFLYIDLLLIIPIAIFMSWSKPFHKIVKKRPSANLVSLKILVPLLVSIIIILIFQIIPWLIVQHLDWYIKPIVAGDNAVQSSDNTILFFISNFQYILIAIILTIGPPYREKISKNMGFIIDISLSLLISLSLMYINPDNILGSLLQLTKISGTFKVFILLWVFFNYWALDIIPKFIKPLFKKKKSSKLYKNLLRLEHESYVV